jgi:hypothetical protein
MSDPDDPFITYAMADGDLIFGEYQFTTELDDFDDRDEEVRLIKRTYKLLSTEEIVLPDPYPIEDDEDEQPERTAEMVANHQHWVWMNDTERWEVRGTGVSDIEPL